jgi:hypothetical protein
MLNDTEKNSTSECVVCYGAHDDEIHEATLRIHVWFHGHVTRNFVDAAVDAPTLLPEPAAA